MAEGIATSIDLARKIGAVIEENNIKVDENMETTVKGLYACGDCTGGILQISKAVYEGTKAGLSIIKIKGGIKMSVTELKSENFESEVNNSEIPVLIDFGLLGVDHAK